MYVGLVQAVAPVRKAEHLPGRIALTLEFPERLIEKLEIGASVAVEGTCLSVTSIDGNHVGFDATTGTLESTNLGTIAIDRLNIERSARLSDEIGGHIIAGHVSCTAEIVSLETGTDHMSMTLKVPDPWNRYIFNRGFLAVNGCSLTVAKVEGDLFTINLIPETLSRTTFGLYKPGDAVNIEVDQQTMVLVDTVERAVSGAMVRLARSTSPTNS